ncbi:thermonuclease family protein [Arthrobacter sp. H20]|uniref:thermonuclease family protein n=1 Tax=Arthrobacter sp. H20 TaxID=1267981 RepID=UPI0004AEA43F|nr:thermonuclease family protein [Arthrobacter sp. H20]
MLGSFGHKRRRFLIAIVLAASVVAGIAGCGPASADAQAGEVVRVIDGDTLVINFNNEDQTVRLLNVDTPETKHPDKAVECLGPEATAFLELTLPPGTPVGLDFDVERTDQYDRVLAAVVLENGTLVNAEIARQGLGMAVLFEPNSKYFDVVRDAQAEATTNETGLYDPAAECTVPAEIEQMTAAVTEALEGPVGETAAATAAAVGVLAAALASAKTLLAALKVGEESVRWLAHSTAAGVTMLAGLASTIDSGQSRLDSMEVRAETLKSEEADAKAAAAAKKAEATRVAAEKKAQAEAATVAEQERQEAQLRVEAERLAAEAAAAAESERLAAAERERLRDLPAPYVPPAPQPYVPPAPLPVPPVVQPPPAAQEPFPGYTGPRCYAPGGKTWKPCP